MNSSSAKKIAQTSPDILWFVARGNVLKGPYTTEQLFDCIKRKEVAYLDFCWRQGFREWRPISSVDDLDRRKRLSRVPSYPTVEVPGGGSEVPAPKSAVSNRREETPVRIAFTRSRRHNISLYEWAFAIIFAVGFAHFSTQFALKTVSEDFLRLWDLKVLGRVESVGDRVTSPTPEVWAPLFSAPSLADTADSGFVSLEVSQIGTARPSADGVELAGYSVKGPLAQWESWKVQDTALDPVYTRTFEIHGRLSTRDARLIEIEATGEPWLKR
jgi:hypothetical protein